MGGTTKFMAALGGVRITRWDTDLTAFSPPPPFAVFFDVALTNDTFGASADTAKYSIAHELGHVWDFRNGNRLSFGMIQAMHTWSCPDDGVRGCIWDPFANSERPAGANPNCTMQNFAEHKDGCAVPYALTYGGGGPLLEGAGWEDWAQSFASYVYPQYYSSQKERLTDLLSGGIRETYVRNQIDGLP